MILSAAFKPIFCVDMEIEKLCDKKSKNYVKPTQLFNIGSTLFQRCESTLKLRWSDVENETKFDSVRQKTLVPEVETTSKEQCTTLKQHQNNVDTTLYQLCFNLASTLAKTILNPIGLIMIMDL